MVKGDNQKLKMLHLVQILAEYTDDHHGMTMQQIIDKLEKVGVHADRKTLYLDLEELERFGIDIISQRTGRNTFYHMGNRQFELAELKILVDSIEAAKFMTDSKSKALIKKLAKLVSRYEADQLERQVVLSGRVKTINRMIYNNVDALHSAISKERQIRFHYCQWDMSGHLVPRHNGKWYVVSPWCLMLDHEYYYLIAYDDEASMIKHYRVDKIKDIYLVDEPRKGREAYEAFDMARYSKCLFGMFGGREVRVSLDCHKDMIGVIIDRFGKDVSRIAKGSDSFIAFVNVVPSPKFYGWVMSLGDKVKIIGPSLVVEEMRNEVRRLNGQYLTEC